MHHKFALLPQLHTATESDYILLKVTHVEVFPNSILVNKNAEIGKAEYERIDRNKILFQKHPSLSVLRFATVLADRPLSLIITLHKNATC